MIKESRHTNRAESGVEGLADYVRRGERNAAAGSTPLNPQSRKPEGFSCLQYLKSQQGWRPLCCQAYMWAGTGAGVASTDGIFPER